MLSRNRRVLVVVLIGIMSIALVCTCVFVLRARTKPASETALYPTSADKSVADVAPNTPPGVSAGPAQPEHEPEGELDLPLPPETQAMIRWHSDPEHRNIKDAEVLWQEREDIYTEYLKKESLAQSAFRTYIMTELMLVLGNDGNFSPFNPDTIRIHARTRRYCKLILEIEQAKTTGELSSVVQTLGETVDRFIAERKSVEEKILALMKEKPELFQPGVQSFEVQKLTMGVGLMGPGTWYISVPDPEEAIPISLRGTKLGVLANTFLLGFTQDPRAVAPLLKVAAYDCEPFLEQYEKKVYGKRIDPGRRLQMDYRLDNPWAIADALDRILMSDAAQSGSSAAATVAGNYSEWRSEQSWPPRETVKIYPFDAPQTPHNLPGSVTGRIQKVQTTTLALPLEVSFDGRPGLVVEDREEILQWARRYHEAMQ